MKQHILMQQDQTPDYYSMDVYVGRDSREACGEYSSNLITIYYDPQNYPECDNVYQLTQNSVTIYKDSSFSSVADPQWYHTGGSGDSYEWDGSSWVSSNVCR